MGRIEKTVFISYRRTNYWTALAIYKDLTAHGFDVFMDLQNIGSGDFEKVIFENIRAKAHFLVVLSPSSLERCKESNDLMRREIEAAMDEKRNIIPLFMENFDFGSPATIEALTGKLADLKKYNGLGIPAEYFDAAMTKLRERFLNIPLESVLHPVSKLAQRATEKQKIVANGAPPVLSAELNAQEWFERGYAFLVNEIFNEAIRCFSEALLIKPDWATAFNNRANARGQLGDLDGAIADCNEAIRLQPDLAMAFANRGTVRRLQGDLDGAIADFNKAINLQPDSVMAYTNRGNTILAKGDLKAAIADYTEAIHLQPNFAMAYSNRSNARRALNDLDGAIADCTEAIRLDPGDAIAYNNRGIARDIKGDIDKAIADYNQAIHLQPKLAMAYCNRGLAYEHKGELDNAIGDYDKAIRLKPDYAVAYSLKGNGHRARGELYKAIVDYSQALILQPDLAPAFHGRGVIYELQGENQNAVQYYEKAVRFKPERGSYRSSLMGILRKLGRNNEADLQEKLARELIAKENEYNQACFEAICGNTEKALELLKIAIEGKQNPRQWARLDPNFENLRADPRFQELVSE